MAQVTRMTEITGLREDLRITSDLDFRSWRSIEAATTKAINAAKTKAFQQVGRALIEAADNYPSSVAYVLAVIGEKLSRATVDSLICEGLMVIAEEVMTEEERKSADNPDEI